MCNKKGTCVLLLKIISNNIVYNRRVKLDFGLEKSKQSKNLHVYLETKRRSTVSVGGPALHQFLNVPRADVAQAGLQAALFRPFILQPASQGVWSKTITMKLADSLWRSNRMQRGGRVQLDLHGTATHHTNEQSPQGGRTSAEQRELPSNCPNRSFPQCLASSGSPLRR